MSLPTKDNFYLEEYKSVRSEIAKRIEQRFNIQKWTLIASGAIYGAAATTNGLKINEDQVGATWALWWLPFFSSHSWSRIFFYMILYPVHARTRKSFGSMTRKLSVTELQNSCQFCGTSLRRKLSTSPANSLEVA